MLFGVGESEAGGCEHSTDLGFAVWAESPILGVRIVAKMLLRTFRERAVNVRFVNECVQNVAQEPGFS